MKKGVLFTYMKEEDFYKGAFIKTKLCKYYLSGKCRNGKNCKFAHGYIELRRGWCFSYHAKGYCRCGISCPFAH